MTLDSFNYTYDHDFWFTEPYKQFTSSSIQKNNGSDLSQTLLHYRLR